MDAVLILAGWMAAPFLLYAAARLASTAYFNSKLEYEEKQRGNQQKR